MATVNSKQLVDEIIANDGHYSTDPQVLAIVEYRNDFNGEPAWGLCYQRSELMGYMLSPYCHAPKVIFRAKE